MRVDIYAGEKQPLTFGFLQDQAIAIVSEKYLTPARVFLKRKHYDGVLKIVCLDCPAKVFNFQIDPDAKQPIKFLC